MTVKQVRGIVRTMNRLIETSKLAEAVQVAEQTPGALQESKIRDRYAHALRLAGDEDKAVKLFEAHSEDAGELIAEYIAKLPEKA